MFSLAYCDKVLDCMLLISQTIISILLIWLLSMFSVDVLLSTVKERLVLHKNIYFSIIFPQNSIILI